MDIEIRLKDDEFENVRVGLDHLRDEMRDEEGCWLQPCGDLRLAGLSDGVSRP
jgi:hypothetical protein